MTHISTQLETREILNNLGLDEREAAIYLALLENGPMLPQHLARATGIKRTTLYEIFPELEKTGVICEIQQGKRRFIQANSPETLFREHERRYRDIKGGLSELMTIYRMQGLKPKIEVYEGFEGLKKLYLRTLDIKKTIKCYVQVTKYNPKMLEWLEGKYVAMRVKHHIDVQAILPAEKESTRFMKAGKEHLRETKLVPWKKFPFRIEGMIQGNRTYFASYEKGRPLVGILIESNQIADSLGALFDLAWEGADKYATRT